MYKLTQVKQVCEVVYGRTISDRTWRRWKHKLGFQDYEREVTQAKLEQLITFASMRRKNPLKQIDLLAVLNCKNEVIEKIR